MGLAALGPSEPWIEVDDELGAYLREKRRLLHDERSQVFVELAQSREAQREVLELLTDYLTQHHPEQYSRAGRRLRVQILDAEVELEGDAPPLERAARLVQEDLCLMQDVAGRCVLSAGAVCFPTRWDLPSKLGLPLAAIHERVPAYAQDLAPPADRFFARIKSGRVFRRTNWTLVDSPALFQPTGKLRTEHAASIDAANAGERVWIRMESQTLQRLPRTGAVLFTIRVLRTPLCTLEKDPTTARAMAASLRTMSDAFLLYKSFPPIREAVYGYLETLFV
jgi:hypothetical protein